MIGKEIIGQKYITVSEANAIMIDRAGEELSYEHGCALDYLQKFAKLSPEDAKKLVEELMEIGVDEKHAVKIADILPKDYDDLRVIYYKEDLPSNKDEILEIVAKYL
ncbi:RNA polymerase Rpb4 family protein [Methanotorris igneus]|uniref:DNA-directed RNA polymerase subunit Rpo4 n=1 Tax=Methanotorris igneus (strain DSM 5666 / JCM 11834 / Kol 5) TaxID=880724 RepID=F6BCJ2_METIK|nr:RNA polymerase Rpb4 family protein [Methanotorris igneus]AEF96203.1 RNA polymerase Rpb4 [Methanotorris igneus Kol 5]